MLRIVKRVVSWPHDQTTVVWRDSEAIQRFRHLLSDRVIPNIVDKHLQQMPHVEAAGFVVQAAGFQRGVDIVRQLFRVRHVPVRLAQVDETGAARGNDLAAVVVQLSCQREIAGNQRIGRQRRQRHILRGATAVPVIHFRKFNP